MRVEKIRMDTIAISSLLEMNEQLKIPGYSKE